MASGVANAIFIRQLEEIQEHIGLNAFNIPHEHPSSGRPLPGITVLTDSTSATPLVQKMGLNRRSKHIKLRSLWLQGIIKLKGVSPTQQTSS